MLGAIETGMRAHEWVPVPEITRITGLSARKVEHRLRLLLEQKMVCGRPYTTWATRLTSMPTIFWLSRTL